MSNRDDLVKLSYTRDLKIAESWMGKTYVLHAGFVWSCASGNLLSKYGTYDDFMRDFNDAVFYNDCMKLVLCPEDTTIDINNRDISRDMSGAADDLASLGFDAGYASCGECHKVSKIDSMIELGHSLYCADCIKPYVHSIHVYSLNGNRDFFSKPMVEKVFDNPFSKK